MKTIYLVFGLIGLITSLVTAIYAFVQRQFTVGILCMINVVTSTVFIAVATLIDKTEKLNNKCNLMENYLLTTDEYHDFLKSINVTEDEIKDGSIRVEDNHDEVIISSLNISKTEYAKKLLKNKEYSKAFMYFQEAANEGDVNSYVYLGNCYMLGYGSVIDKTIAVGWFEKASNAGIADGTFLLGLAYLHGDGVEKDVDNAINLIQEAANQGSEKAKAYIVNNKF